MRQFLLSLLLIWLIVPVFGQTPKYSNEFLSIGVGARAHGLSGAYIASVRDVSAAYWNPAGLTGLYKIEASGRVKPTPFQISAMHAEWFAGIAQYDYLGIAKTLNEQRQSVLSLSLVRFGVDQIPNTLNLVSPDGSINYDNVTEFSTADYGFFISYAQKLKNPQWSVGASTKIIRRVIGNFGGAWGFGVDAGLQYHGRNWTFALMGRDLSSTYNAWKFNLTEDEKRVFTRTGNVIPVSSVEITLPRVIAGFAFEKTFDQKYHFLAEIDFDFTFDGKRNVLITNDLIAIDPHLGVEIGYSDFLYLRGGIGNIQKAKDDQDGTTEIVTVQPNFGIGLRLGRVTIDYALTDIGDVSQVLFSNIFSLLINLKKRRNVPGLRQF